LIKELKYLTLLLIQKQKRTPHPYPAMHFASLNPMGFTSFNLPQGERGFIKFPPPLMGGVEGEGDYVNLLNSFSIIIILLSLFIVGCVGKPPENDVALIKQLLEKFEKGLKEKNLAVLSSIINKKQKGLSTQLITDFSTRGEIKNIYIANKRFTIVKDSAEVELKLKIEALKSGGGLEELEKSVNLFLNKKRGKWKIETYQIMINDE